MATKMIICPECNHKHRVKINGLKTRSIGVRAKRVTNKQFEYELTAPDKMVETERFTTIQDDLILTGALGAAVGSVCGFCASLFAPEYTLEIIGTGCSAGVTLAWGWLCAETNQRLKRVVPWFVEQKGAWQRKYPQVSDAVELTVDHRFRDGNTEAGRTIQYFGVLPVDVDRFNEYARAVLGTDNLPGESLAIAKWTGKGKLFSRDEYEALLNLLQGPDLVVKKPGKGNMLTGGGRRALRQHLKQYAE